MFAVWKESERKKNRGLHKLPGKWQELQFITKCHASVEHKADECFWPYKHARENSIRQQHMVDASIPVVLYTAFLSFPDGLLKFDGIILHPFTYHVNR